ncbi:MAG TPA: hypothetical protein VFD84_17520 [Candidatus Binatia bacterium]|jgi:hypothetical protein|nr:hypothetical protein [Candidatus Binatia bacterium]
MIGRKLGSVLVTVVFGLSLSAAPAMAKNHCSPLKNHTKGCKNEIRGCQGIHLCKDRSVKGKNRRKCLRSCKTDIVNACKADNTVCTASPSGAFLDAID